MHPVLVCLIVVGGVAVAWGAYEAADTLYEWYQDRKEQREYEEYVRMHAEKGRAVPVTTYFENEDDEEEEEDNEPLAIWKRKRDSLNSTSELRHRNNVLSQEEREMSEFPPPKYELYEMERSISERRSLLEKENEILLQQEAELERKRSLLRSKGNSITGVFHDDEEELQNPFADSSSSFIEQQQKLNSSASSSSSSMSRPILINNEKSIQQQQLLSTSPQRQEDLGGSWSDLNDAEEDFKHERTDSGESFHHV